jgi:carbamoyl-phosphate synthase large subunit
VNDPDKPSVLPMARDLEKLGFTLVGTKGTADFLAGQGVKIETVYKVNEGAPPAST